ncbi:hypothetical protein [Fodinicola feengrottensis]|uniref:Uncharacterized protein n=1 Tax=Fodinicola feengrottensis TaxID=435914 RepID=A0ABP4SPS3_9ACTN|nr:hypothetical protein [Fodinicola feengrottensis]
MRRRAFRIIGATLATDCLGLAVVGVPAQAAAGVTPHSLPWTGNRPSPDAWTPTGTVDNSDLINGKWMITGRATDPSTSNTIKVVLAIGTNKYPLVASRDRTDAHNPRGFGAKVPAAGITTPQPASVVAINVGAGHDYLLGQTVVSAYSQRG